MPNKLPTIDIPFGLGIETKTDEKLVMPGRLIELENGRFDKLGRVSKRPGLASFTGFGASVGRLGADDHLLTMRDASNGDQYIRGRAGHNILGYLARNSVFPRLVGGPIGGPINAGASTEYTVKTFDLAMDQTAKRNGLGVYTDTFGGVWFTAFDYETMRPNVSVTPSILAGSNARVLARGNADTFIVGAYDTGTLRIYDNVVVGQGVLNTPNSAVTVPAPSVTIAGLNATPIWDWFLLGSTLFVVHLDAAGTTMTLARYTVGTWVATTATWAVSSVQSATVSANTTANIVGAFWGTAAAINYRGYNATTHALVHAGGALYSPGGSPNFEMITAYVDSGNLWFAAQENGGASIQNKTVRYGSTFDLAGTVVITSAVRGLALGGKMSSRKHLPCIFDTSTQRQLLFYDVNTRDIGSPALLAGRIFYGTGGPMIQQKLLPAVTELSRDGVHNDIIVGCSVAAVSTETAATPNPQFVMGYAEAWLPGQRPYPCVVLDGRALYGGGYLHSIGANGIVPNGFLAYPESISLTPATTGGSLADGQYGVKYTLEWTDELGAVHESAPSPPAFATVSGGGGAGRLDFVALAQVFDWARISGAVNAWLVVYRTRENGSTYYREKRFRIPVSQATVSGSLTTAGTTLDDFGILPYGPGVEVEPAQPDAPIAMCVDLDRVWVVTGSAQNQVRPSKPKRTGIGLEFFPAVYRTVSPRGDGVVALARQDGKIFAFKKLGCFYASGDGPDALGGNDNLTEFVSLFPSIGAEAQNAAIAGTAGIYVKGAKDIWRIGRDLQPLEIGEDVRAYTTLPLRDAVLIEDQDQVRFLLGAEASSCSELVLDERVQQWSLTPRAANAGTRPSVVQFDDEIYYYLGNAFFKETPAAFVDGASGYALKLVTAWLKPWQVLQGFGRIRRALLLGENLAAHTLQYRVRYDYETTWSAPRTITSANATAGASAYQPEIRFPRQKCQAFQLEITEVTPNGQGFSLAGMTLEVLPLGGAARLRAEKRM